MFVFLTSVQQKYATAFKHIYHDFFYTYTVFSSWTTTTMKGVLGEVFAQGDYDKGGCSQI